MNLSEQFPDLMLPVRVIPLTQGKFALVDPEDYDLVMSRGHLWCAHWEKKAWYAVGGYRPQERMHMVITGHRRTDHINHNGLDNRRFNLRAATSQQNSANQKLAINNTSGHKGVVHGYKPGTWWARIWVDGKQRHLGTFDNIEDAIKARQRAEQEAFGEYAYREGNSQ